MKKNIGAQLALYPCPVIVVGAMVNGKPMRWQLRLLFLRCAVEWAIRILLLSGRIT